MRTIIPAVTELLTSVALLNPPFVKIANHRNIEFKEIRNITDLVKFVGPKNITWKPTTVTLGLVVSQRGNSLTGFSQEPAAKELLLVIRFFSKVR